MPNEATHDALKNALPCPCDGCDGTVHLAEASKARGQMVLGLVVTCKKDHLQAEPHYDVNVAVKRWNALVREFEAKEDAELNAIADARAGGPFVEVDINKI